MCVCVCITDVQWKLVSPGYLKRFSEQSAASSWRHFLLNLGVRDKIVVGTVTEKIPEVCVYLSKEAL